MSRVPRLSTACAVFFVMLFPCAVFADEISEVPPMSIEAQILAGTREAGETTTPSESAPPEEHTDPPPSGEEPPPDEPPGGGEGTESEEDPDLTPPETIKTPVPQAEAGGSLQYQFPIEIPPGRNKLQPEVVLRYNSQASHIEGWFGQGWDLTIPSIETSSKKGIEYLYSVPTFTSSFSGELVRAASGTYASRYEDGDFFSYAFNGTSWSVKDKKGTTYLFGSASTSRMDDPNANSRIFKWMLSEIRDTNDNYVRYEYYKNQGQIYPSKIFYTGSGAVDGLFEIEFLRESRANAPRQYNAGFLVTTAYRIYEIRAKVNGSWVRKYALGYANGDGGARPMLTTITESGQDEATATVTTLTAQSQTYQASTNGYATDTAIVWPQYDSCSPGYYPTPVLFASSAGYPQGVNVVDVNGDAQPDILMYLRGYCDEIGAWINNGNGTGWTRDDAWSPPVPLMNSDGRDYYGAQFVEVNGDGLIDIVYSAYFSGYLQSVYINNGHGWTSNPYYIWPSNPTNPSYPLIFVENGYSLGARVLDVNGDGLADIIKYIDVAGSIELGAWINKGDGTGWVRDDAWVFPFPFSLGGGQDTHGAQFGDYNGDGLTDFYFARSLGGGNYESAVYINNGHGWTSDSGFTSPEDYFVWNPNPGIPLQTVNSPSSYSTGVRALDVNGDGFDDLIKADHGFSKDFAVYINKGDGTGWTRDTNWGPPVPFTQNSGSYTAAAQLADMNGDGLTDIVYSGYYISQSPITNVFNRNGKPADTLTRVTNTHGGKTDVTYKGSAQYRNELSPPLNPSLPYSIQVVQKIANDDGFGTVSTKWYSYENGKQWRGSAQDRRFAGFEKITEIDAASNTEVTFYHQGDASATGTGEYLDHYSKIGKPYRTLRIDATEGTQTVSINTWDRTPTSTGPGVSFDAATSFDVSGTTTSQSHTITGSNNALVCGIVGAGGDHITGVTWNGTALTQMDKRQPRWNAAWRYLFALNGASGGAHSIVVSSSSGTGIGLARCASYVGVSAVSFPHAQGYFTGYTYPAAQQSATTTTEGATAVVFVGNDDGNWYQDAVNVVPRGSASSQQIFDSNGPIPTGVYTMTISGPTSRPWTWQELALLPAVSTPIIPEWDFVQQTQKLELTYDGDADHKDKAESFAYNTSNGNLSQRIFWGQVTGSDDGTFTDTANDKRSLEIAYATNTTDYVIGLPSTEALWHQNGAKLRETKYYYDTQSHGSVTDGNLTKEERWKTGSTYIDTEKSYNGYGLITQEKDPRDKATNYTYDSYNLYPSTTTNPLSHILLRSFDYSSGLVKSATDPNLLVFSTKYDGLDRPLEERQPDQSTTTTSVLKASYTYGDTSLAAYVKKNNLLDGTIDTATWTYLDGFDRPIQSRTDVEASGTYAASDIIYDNRGFVLKESLPYFSSGSSRTSSATNTDLYTTYAYDAMGRVTSATNAVGTTSHAFDDWKETVTDPRGKPKHLYHDAYGRLIKVEEVISSSPYATQYEYDGNDNLTKLTDANGNIRNFTYDALGRRLTAQDLHGAADASYGVWTYGYDNSGNLTSTVDPSSRTVNYIFDDLNRVTSEDYTGASGTEVTYTYDSCQYGKGKLCTASNSGALTSRLYGPTGQVTTETKTILSVPYQTDTTYDRQGNLLTLKYPDGAEMKNTWNGGSLLEKVERKESGGSWKVLVRNFDYSPIGKPTEYSYENSATTTNTYDASKLYRLTNKTLTTPGGTKRQDFTYTYDANGNVTRTVDASQTNSAKTIDYGYDDLNRLTGATSTNAVYGTNYSHNYSYDPIGNITYRSDVGAYSYPSASGYANPHAVISASTTNLLYDNNGNLATRGSDAFTWNYRNLLLSAVVNGATSTYAYGPEGERTRLTESSTATIYASKWYASVAGVPMKHFFAGDMLVATIDNSTSSAILHYIHPDHLTGTSIVTSVTGGQNELLDYYPYGTIRLDQKSGAWSERVKFAGQEKDDLSSLSYMGARYYEPAIGRFLSEDPAFLNLSFKLEDPQSLNSYAYARNNPLVYIDPDGKTFWAVVSGHQSIGSYGNELYANNGAARFIMDHPYAPAAIGAAPLAAYGIVSSGALATPVGAAIARQGGLGAIGGTIGQYLSDVGNNLADGKDGLGALAPTSSPGSYVSSAGKGFVIGTAAEFGGAPAAGLGAAGTSIGSDLVNRKSVSWGNALLNGALSFGATGLSEAASSIPGRLPNPGSFNYFFGAHAQQEALKEAVGVGIEGTKNITQPTVESLLKKKK